MQIERYTPVPVLYRQLLCLLLFGNLWLRIDSLFVAAGQACRAQLGSRAQAAGDTRLYDSTHRSRVVFAAGLRAALCLSLPLSAASDS